MKAWMETGPCGDEQPFGNGLLNGRLALDADRILLIARLRSSC